MNTLNQTTVAKVIARKIKPQFTNSPYGLLMFHIVQCALLDAARMVDKEDTIAVNEQQNAQRYLQGSMPHCELANVDSSWVHRVIGKAGLVLPTV